MYAVVGCSECSALWVLEGRPETSECPRCGHRRDYAKRRKFHTTDDADEAREARARLLAARQDAATEFAAVGSFTELEAQVDDAGVDDETYLEAAGVDPEAVAEAGERTTSAAGSQSRTETVRTALRELEAPSEAAIREYCSERGVAPSFVDDALAKLVRAGEVTEQDGTYRLL